jgi:hypothetical protein
MARADAQAAAKETAGLNSRMLEIAIALIIGFALGYAVRAWVFPLISTSRTAATPFLIKDYAPMSHAQNEITIYGPKSDGTYLVEFRTAEGQSLAISIPGSEAAVLKFFQARMPHGVIVPDVDSH